MITVDCASRLDLFGTGGLDWMNEEDLHFLNPARSAAKAPAPAASTV